MKENRGGGVWRKPSLVTVRIQPLLDTQAIAVARTHAPLRSAALIIEQVNSTHSTNNEGKKTGGGAGRNDTLAKLRESLHL